MSFDLATIAFLKLDKPLLISNLASNANDVTLGSAYFAIKGNKFDGHNFIDLAISKGASVVFSEQDIKTEILSIKVSNVREALAIIASKFYPSEEKTIVAVTGTNGKTSISHFYRQIMYLTGHNAASLGTTGLMINDSLVKDESLTTPDPIMLNKTLYDIKSDYICLEASSHGISQYRLDGLNLAAAAFSNFTQDHLDYHGSMAEYLEAKTDLFKRVLGEGKIAILNADIKEFEDISDICAHRSQKIIDYGFKAKDFIIKNISNNLNEQVIQLLYQNQEYKIKTKLIGDFQAYNIICALALSIASGVDIEKSIGSLANLTSVPGRMQRVGNNMFVDYAHTPDALAKALELLKPLTEGKLIVLFGCGGDRDKSKRPLMGRISQEYADLIIITDDNPRSEDPNIIRKEIISGIISEKVIEIPNREDAIKYAIENMHKDDILLIAGKGHEKYQIIGDKTYDFDDVAIAEKYWLSFAS